MRVTVKAPARHLCPYRDEVDEGTAELAFEVALGSDAPELHDLASWLDGYAALRMSHENYTQHVLDGSGAVRVVTTWRTAGLDVTCEASR